MPETYSLPDITILGTNAMNVQNTSVLDNSFSFSGAGTGASGGAASGASAMMPALALFQGVVKGISSWKQSKQVRENSRVMEQDMENRKQAMLSARIANSKRESNITSHKLADIESAYAVSGIEMGGDIANYISEVAAVEEMNTQQLNQNAFYTAAVMDVQIENMKMAAKQKEKAFKINAFTSFLGASFDAGESYSENASYWEKYGAGSGSPNPSAGDLLNG